MPTSTDAEAIRDALGVLRIKWRGHDDARIDDASIDEAVTAILSYLASRSEAQEPVGWMHEDELPSSYPYGRMFAYSKVRDGVRMFPVYAPSPSPAPAGEVERLRAIINETSDALARWQDQHHDCDCAAHESCGCKELRDIRLTLDYFDFTDEDAHAALNGGRADD